MAEHADPKAQLAEYESQLADVIEMLILDPNEESLIKLRDDLTELIALTKSELPGKSTNEERDDTTSAEAAAPVADKLPPPPPPPPPQEIPPSEGEGGASNAVALVTKTADDATGTAAAPTKKKKKSKSSVNETFEVPDHLKPLPSDTDAERKRKSRTVKALKSKWRERKKEAEGIEKQKSWQDFMGKKKKKGGSKRDRSIFATEEGVNAKVGVISGTSGVRGNMTEFDGRKRHKH